MLTLTAPGVRQHPLPNGDVCKCTPAGGVDLQQWNGRCVDRWNDLSRALARHFGVERFAYFKAVEVQRRGALHLHVLIRFDRPVRFGKRPAKAESWAPTWLRNLAIHHGYGHSVDVVDVTDGRQALYCSKYVSKAAGERHQVPFVHRLTGEVGPGRWRTWSCSRDWSPGESMGAMRARVRSYWTDVHRAAAAAGGRRDGGALTTDGATPWHDGAAGGPLDTYCIDYASPPPDPSVSGFFKPL